MSRGSLGARGCCAQLGISWADTYIAPVFWFGFPAILKRSFECGFALGDAYTCALEGWQGQVKGRALLLCHKKALIMSATLFSEAGYAADWQAPMTRIEATFSIILR